ncbi:MAG: bifunctional diguanylate cyclase/phosphodiesterase, partial [Sulfuricella sp.]
RQMKIQYKLPGDIYVFDETGNLITSSVEQGTPRGRSMPPNWRLTPRDDFRFIDKSTDPYTGQAIVAFSNAVHAAYIPGKTIGYLVVTYPWTAVASLLHADNASLVVLTRSGKVLYNGTGTTLSPVGVERLLAHATRYPTERADHMVAYAKPSDELMRLPWQVAAIESSNDMKEYLHTAWVQIALGIVLFGVPVGILIVGIIYRFTRPLVELTATVLEISKSSDLSKRVAVTAGDEVGLLQRAFNEMASRLQQDIIGRKKAEGMLSRLGHILDESSNEIYMFDAQTLHFILVNVGAQRNLGYSMDELRELTPLDLNPKLTPEMFERLIAPLRRGEMDSVVFETEHKRKDKSLYPIETRLQLTTREVTPVFVAIIQDITERKRAELELRITATAFETQEGILITDRDNRILRVNHAFTRLTGYSAEEAIGRTPAMLKSGRHDAAFYRSMWETLNRDKYWQEELWNQRKDGVDFPAWLTITAVTDADGQLTNYVGVFSDITLRKETEEKIHQLAFYDPLTKLPNRSLLRDRLQQTLTYSTRHKNHGAILFIDLDNFKILNDTRGHDIGDLLLTEVAKRLQDCVRSGDTVARLGGDEFVVMLKDLSEDAQQAAAAAQDVGEKVLASTNRPFNLQGFEYHSSSSIGISLFRGDGMSMDDLLKHADTAMYQAKSAGRNTLRFFDPVMQAELEIRAAMEADLRQALPHQQLKLYYQVQVNEQGVVGAEALLRWQHPERGLISPMEFIPLAEETGLIVPIGKWVLQMACAQLEQWENDSRTCNLQLAVNVSARQFRQPDFVDLVLEVLKKSGINPHKLKLELTESLVLDNITDSIDKMQALRSAGIRFSLDDFGTGQSSLTYLKRLPLYQIKIDQSFVRDITTDPNDAAIVRTIIGMANNLGLDIIAEGVETEQQRDFLERNGCHAYQGYLFGKPVPIEEFQNLVSRLQL